jgi:hypothetical protein
MSPNRLLLIFFAVGTICFSLVFVFYYIPWIYVLLWPGYVYTFMGIAYCVNIPDLFRKDKTDGTLSWLTIIILLPYLFPMWFVWCEISPVKDVLTRVLGTREDGITLNPATSKSWRAFTWDVSVMILQTFRRTRAS